MDLTELERRVVEAAITERKAWADKNNLVRGGEEKVEAWYTRSGPVEQRWSAAIRTYCETVEALIKYRDDLEREIRKT